jgi:NADH:ubiquinone oxidoreductase subunit C
MFLLKNCEFLQFNQLIDVVAHDRLSFKKRFNLIYVISSVVNNCKFFISLQTAEGSPIFSVVNLFESAS